MVMFATADELAPGQLVLRRHAWKRLQLQWSGEDIGDGGRFMCPHCLSWSSPEGLATIDPVCVTRIATVHR